MQVDVVSLVSDIVICLQFSEIYLNSIITFHEVRLVNNGIDKIEVDDDGTGVALKSRQYIATKVR